MNKILITGLGIGKDFGVCDASNMNYEELLLNPEVLLWADKICIPSVDHYRDSIIDKECKLVFSILEDQGLIYRYSVNAINEERCDDVIRRATEDIQQIAEYDPALVISNNRSLQEIEMVDSKFCIPRISSIYASLILADEIQANCLFNKSERDFFEFQLQRRLETDKLSLIPKVYRELLSYKLPNEPILHSYGRYKNCDICIKTEECKDSYLQEVEKNLRQYLSFRNYDEMIQLRKVIDDIIENKSKLLTDVEIEDVISDIEYRQNYIKKNLNQRFKKVKKFANLTTIVATSMAMFGVFSPDPIISKSSAIIGGMSKITEAMIEKYNSNNNWVNFIDINNTGRC